MAELARDPLFEVAGVEVPDAPEQVNDVVARIRACIASGPGLSVVAPPGLSRAMPSPPRLDADLDPDPPEGSETTAKDADAARAAALSRLAWARRVGPGRARLLWFAWLLLDEFGDDARVEVWKARADGRARWWGVDAARLDEVLGLAGVPPAGEQAAVGGRGEGA